LQYWDIEVLATFWFSDWLRLIGERDKLYYILDTRQLDMALFLTMAEQQPEEKKEQKPLSQPEKHAENIDDVLAARTIEEILKETAKKLPQVDKGKQSEGSSQSGTHVRGTLFLAPINSIVFSSLGATVIVLW
jgi:hypothetical protein